MKRLILALVSCALFCAAESRDARTIILVRHGEKASQTGDTKLSEKGLARALALAESLRDIHLQKIYVSQFLRTQETAAPIAKLQGLRPEIMSTEKEDLLVEALRKTPSGTATLVVYHGGKPIPQIVEKLGGGNIPEIPEEEFDRMVILTMPAQGMAHVLTLRYGGR